MECFKKFVAKPADNLNSLNSIIPSLIESMDLTKIAQLNDVIRDSELIQKSDYTLVISGADSIGNSSQDKVVLFITQRLRVLL